MKSKPTIQRIRELFNYDSVTGIVTWRIDRPNGWNAGDIVDGLNKDGYLVCKVDGSPIGLHQIAWAHYYGIWPSKKLDHRDTIRTHNWIDNLREATDQQNQFNRRTPVTNKTGFRGVRSQSGRHTAYIRINKVKTCLGTFDTPEQAAMAYDAKAREIHGEFYCPTEIAS